jgi:general secretion pathway protein D
LVLALSACGTTEEPKQVPPTSRIFEEPAPLIAPAGGQDRPTEAQSQPTTLAGAPAEDTRLDSPEIYTGTGQLARGTPRAAETVVGSQGQVTLNFANADIREVIDVVLGETLGISYIIDPAVQGTVTARTSQPLPRDAVIPALENILALNGAALVKTDGLYRVVTRESAVGSLSRPVVSPSQRQLKQGAGIRIIPLKFASATEVSELMKPFIGSGSSLNVDSARNLLIFAGPGSEAVELVEMAKVFDVDWMAGMSFGLFPVEIAGREPACRPGPLRADRALECCLGDYPAARIFAAGGNLGHPIGPGRGSHRPEDFRLSRGQRPGLGDGRDSDRNFPGRHGGHPLAARSLCGARAGRNGVWHP